MGEGGVPERLSPVRALLPIDAARPCPRAACHSAHGAALLGLHAQASTGPAFYILLYTL